MVKTTNSQMSIKIFVVMPFSEKLVMFWKMLKDDSSKNNEMLVIEVVSEFLGRKSLLKSKK